MRAIAPVVAAGMALAGCLRQGPSEDPARIAMLKATHDHLHAHLETSATREPLMASALADRGQVAVAIRSELMEELAGNVARRYLDRTTVDLSDVEAHAGGELERKTLLGRVKLGAWQVTVDLGSLAGHLRAGTPRVRLRSPDRIDVELPVEIQETEGEATLRFAWDSSGLANVVCRDFELSREIRGRVLAQRHVLSGALRLDNTGESVTATPEFPDRQVPLKLDLTKDSWEVVEAALRSQDTLGTCGLLMDPDKGVARLKELAARGIDIRLPDAIFRTVSLPARLQKSVTVNDRTVGFRVKAEHLRVEGATLWSSASVQVQGPTGQGPRAGQAPTGTSSFSDAGGAEAGAAAGSSRPRMPDSSQEWRWSSTSSAVR